jgi:uncharacterized protein
MIPTAGMSTSSEILLQAIPPSERIGVLDVLRGIAMLGMFLVHFNDHSIKGVGLAAAYGQVVKLFFDERFFTMFAILFGVGFAIQIRRSESRGDRFIARYVRRMFVLLVIGFTAAACFGFFTLLTYALWGLPLLLIRNWSHKAIVLALVVCAASPSIYFIASTSYGVATMGQGAYVTKKQAEDKQSREIFEQNSDATHSPQYATVFAARVRLLRQFYSRPVTLLPAFPFMLFLLGLLGLRLGLFERAREHRRLILALMVFGVVSWGLVEWVLPLIPPPNSAGSIVGQVAGRQLRRGIGLVHLEWLSFTYIGGLLLLVARNPIWLRRLAVFGWTGRMALTNYILQIAIIDVTFSQYGFGLSMTPFVAAGAALLLFAIDALISRWWLVHFRYGPLEWLWRSATYARVQPLRVDRTT